MVGPNATSRKNEMTSGTFGFVSLAQQLPKIQQTKMLVACQRFGDLFLFGLVWQYSSNHKTCNKGRFKVIAAYLQQ